MDVGDESAGETPQPTSATTSGNAGTPAVATASTSSKRRRGLGIVTPNACTECRKKRAKCDGHKPCGRCKSQKDAECIYEVPVRQSKENLRTEIESLRTRQRSSDQVLGALSRPDLWEEVLGRLRNGQSVESISDWLGNAQHGGGGGRMTTSLPPIPRHDAPGPTLAPISSFIGTSGGALEREPAPQLAPLNLGMSPMMNMSGGGGSNNNNNDNNHNSPWNFSSNSHPGSTRSSSNDNMTWQHTTTTHHHPQAPPGHIDIPAPLQFRSGSWAPELHKYDHMSEKMPRFRGLELILSPLNEPEMRSQNRSWTTITDDINLVQHLLALYFCWEYPTFASLSKEHFLRDFQDGRHRYCSPILVNALLALGCRFSTKPMTRADPQNPYSSGDHFFKEAQRLFYQEHDHHSLTTIQALGIMSIREASCGRDSESWYYAGQSIRLAIEMGLHRLHDQGDEDELAVQAATFWGAFALDHAWSLATGSLPQCSCFPHLPPKPAIINDIEASLWVPYTDDGAPMHRMSSQPSNVRSVYKCFCELSELVHQSSYILHSPGKPLNARDLLNIYTQYLNWYDRIPEVLRLGHNFTPAVLFAHMYYHFAILLLFRPLIKLRILGSKIAPRDVCIQAADAIQGLLKSYSQLYTLQRTPSFVPYFVLTSAIMHLAIAAPDNATSSGDNPSSQQQQQQQAQPQQSQQQQQPQQSTTQQGPSGSRSASASTPGTPLQARVPTHRSNKLNPKVKESLLQGIKDLEEMAPCHHFAEQALNILRYLARKWNIEVDVDHGAPPPEDYERLVKPFTSSLNFFAPNVPAGDSTCSWGELMPEGHGGMGLERLVESAEGGQGAGAGGGGGREKKETEREGRLGARVAAESMENPLFWPFPMQGRPILPGGKELERAGFALL